MVVHCTGTTPTSINVTPRGDHGAITSCGAIVILSIFLVVGTSMIKTTSRGLTFSTTERQHMRMTRQKTILVLIKIVIQSSTKEEEEMQE